MRGTFLSVGTRVGAIIGNPLWVVPFMSMTLGLLVLLAAPQLGKVPDESYHFWRSVGIAQGNIIAERQGDEAGGHIPKSLQRLHSPLLSTPLNFQDTVWQRFDGATVYSPVPYLPQVTAVTLARVADAPPVVVFYLTRFFNLIAWVALVYLAIRTARAWGWAFGVIALLPMTIFQSATASADVASLGLAMFFVAQLIARATADQKMTRRQFGLLLATGLLLSLTKPPLFLLTLGVLAIPWRQFEGIFPRVRSGRLLATLALVVPAFLIAISWNLIVRQVNVTQGYFAADPDRQIELILQQPGIFLEAMRNMHFGPANDILMLSAIAPNGWLQFATWFWPVVVSYVLIALIFLHLPRPEPRLAGWWQRCVFAVIALLIVVAIDLSLYLYFSPVGEREIKGLQGRYFLPVLLLLPFILRSRLAYFRMSQAGIGLILIVGILPAFLVMIMLLSQQYPLKLNYF